MKYLYILLAQTSVLAAVGLFNLGVSWIDRGHGFHPMAAGALAVVLLLVPYLMAGDQHHD